MPDEAAKWRRRERALAFGLLTWALGIGALATLRPAWTADWILNHHSLEVAGVILVSVGLLGGIFDQGMQLVDDWATAEEDLTEVPWEDSNDDGQ